MGFGPDGIKRIYKTDPTHPIEFFLNKSTLSTLQYDNSDNGNNRLVQTSENRFNMTGESETKRTRIWIKAKVQVPAVVNSAFASAKGHMSQRIYDCDSVENHYYIRHLSGSSYYIIGGPTLGELSGNPCAGQQYQAIITVDGKAWITKKQFHPSGYVKEIVKKSVTTNITDRWIGVKFVILQLGTSKVRLELYLDDGNVTNNWHLIDSRLDQGRWGDLGGVCGSSLPGQALDFGMPNTMILGTGGENSFDLQNLATRCIITQRDNLSQFPPSLGEGAKFRRISQPFIPYFRPTVPDVDDDA